MNDCFNGGFNESVIDGNFQLQLGQESHLEFGPTIDLGKASLPTAAAHIADRHQKDVALGEGFLDGFQVLRSNDGHNQFHGFLRGKLSRPPRREG